MDPRKYFRYIASTMLIIGLGLIWFVSPSVPRCKYSHIRDYSIFRGWWGIILGDLQRGVAGGGQVTAGLGEAGLSLLLLAIFVVVNSGYDQGLGARLTSPGDLIRTLRIPEEITTGSAVLFLLKYLENSKITGYYLIKDINIIGSLSYGLGLALFALTSPWLVGKQTIRAAGALFLLCDTVKLKLGLFSERRWNHERGAGKR